MWKVGMWTLTGVECRALLTLKPLFIFFNIFRKTKRIIGATNRLFACTYPVFLQSNCIRWPIPPSIASVDPFLPQLHPLTHSSLNSVLILIYCWTCSFPEYTCNIYRLTINRSINRCSRAVTMGLKQGRQWYGDRRLKPSCKGDRGHT
jgi:hypothetical protein